MDEKVYASIDAAAEGFDSLIFAFTHGRASEEEKETIAKRATSVFLELAENLSCALTILQFLEQDMGYWLGQSVLDTPSREHAEGQLDALLDEHQSKLFLEIRRWHMHEDAHRLETFLKRSCDRVRERSHAEIDLRHVKAS